MYKTVEEVRRARLKQLVTEVGGKFADLNRKTGKNSTDATYSQISNAAPDSKTGRPREMGSALARDLEAKLEKPRGWMDSDPDSVGQAAWPFSLPYSRFAALPKEAKAKIEGLIEGMVVYYETRPAGIESTQFDLRGERAMFESDEVLGGAKAEKSRP